MKLLVDEDVAGVGRVVAIVDDDDFTVIKYWMSGNSGHRPDVSIEMSPRMGPAAEKIMAQYGGLVSGKKVPGTSN